MPGSAKRPSGGSAPGERKKETEDEAGEGGTRGAGDSEKQQGRGRALAGTAGPLQHRSGGQRPAGPGRGHRGRGEGIGGECAPSPGRGGGIGVAEGAGYLPGPRPGRGRSAAECARAGRVHVAPRELRRQLKGTARRARHTEALPAPRPRPSVTTRAGPRRPGGRPGGSGEEQGRAPPKPAPGPGRAGGRPWERARSPAHHPGPPLRAEPQTPPAAASVRSRLRGPGRGPPPTQPEPGTRALIRFRPCGAPGARAGRQALRSRVGKAFSHPGSRLAAGVGGGPGSQPRPASRSPRGHGKRFSARRVAAVPTGPSAPERCSGLDPRCWAGEGSPQTPENPSNRWRRAARRPTRTYLSA